ncbi:MAG: hypothetical protein MAG795_00724 [Candidatus Woesearchaeota archaeon]|nr:hypothetical protein [Candidatus Woesearchaeota archaeon]
MTELSELVKSRTVRKYEEKGAEKVKTDYNPD